MAKKNSIPQVPRDATPEQRQFFQSLRDALQVQLNQGRGNVLDAAVTFRDLVGTDAFSMSRGSLLYQEPTFEYDGGDVDEPTRPTGVEFFNHWNATSIIWDYPEYAGHSHTAIYRTQWTDVVPEPEEGQEPEEPEPRPGFDENFFIGLSVGLQYADNTVIEGEGYLYWVRHYNVEGRFGPISPPFGEFVTTKLSPDAMLRQEQEWIDESALVPELLARIDLIDTTLVDGIEGGINAALGDARTRLSDAEQSLTDNVERLDGVILDSGTRLNDAELTLEAHLDLINEHTGLLNASATAISDIDLELDEHGNRLGVVESSTDNNAGRITIVESSSADHESRVGSLEIASSDLTSRLDTVEFDTSDALSRVSTLETASDNYASRLVILESADTGAGQEARITALEEVTGDHATRLGTVEQNTDDALSRVATLETASDNYASRLVILETADTGAGQEARITLLEEVTGDHAARLTATEASSIDSQSRISTLETASSDYSSRLVSLETDSIDTQTRVSTLEDTDTDLASRLSTVENVSDDYESRVSSLEVSRNSHSSRLTTVETIADDSHGRVVQLETASDSLAERVVDIEYEFDNASGRITTVENVSADAASRVSSVEYEFDNANGRVYSLEEASSSQTTRLVGLEAEFDGGRVSAIETTIGNASSGLIRNIDLLEAEFDTGGRVTAVEDTLGDAASGLVKQVNQIAVQIDGANGLDDRIGAVETSAVVTSSDIITAQYTMKVDADGVIAGIGLLAQEGGSSEIIFAADNVAFIPTDYTDVDYDKRKFISISPSTGEMFIDTAWIRDLNAENFYGNQIVATSLVVQEYVNLPVSSIHETMLDADFVRSLVRMNPDAVESGGTETDTEDLNNKTSVTLLPSKFTSGGRTVVLRVSSNGWASGERSFTSYNGQYTGAEADAEEARAAEDLTVRIYKDNVQLGAYSVAAVWNETERGSSSAVGRTIIGYISVPPLDIPITDVSAVAGEQHQYKATVSIASASSLPGYVTLSVSEAVGATNGVYVNTQWADIIGKPATYAPSTHSHDYLASGGTAVNSSKLSNQSLVSSAATANTVVSRNGSGDVFVRLLRSTYANQATISGAIAFRVNNGSDNYTRYCSSPAAVLSWLGGADSDHTHSEYAASSHTHSGYAASSHTHDSRYYTESELSSAGTSRTTSGAYKIGVYDELSQSNATNVQDVLDDLDLQIANLEAKDITLTLGGDLTGNCTFTNLGGATLSAEVVNDSHTHDGRYYTETESNSRFIKTFASGNTGVTELGRYIDLHTTGSVADYDVRLDCSSANNLRILGGTLSVDDRIYANGGVSLGDSDYLYIGSGNDAQIYHSGSNFFIDNNTGSSYIDAAATYFRDNGSTIGVFYDNHFRMQDNKNIYLGTGNDFRMYFNGTNTIFRSYAHGGDVFFQAESTGGTNYDAIEIESTANVAALINFNGSEKLRSESSGIKITGAIGINTTPTGNLLGQSAIAFGDGDTGLRQNGDGTLEVFANNQEIAQFTTSAATFHKRADFTNGARFYDNDYLTFGSGIDVEFFCNGLHMYTDLNSGIGNWYIRDGVSTRFTFSDGGGFTAAGNVTAYSDIRLKSNIEVIPHALDKVRRLSGYTYDKRSAMLDTAPTSRETGLIAQELEMVLPEAVLVDENDPDNIRSVAYGNVVGLLVEAIKELERRVDEMKDAA